HVSLSTRPSPPQLSSLSLHDALPISEHPLLGVAEGDGSGRGLHGDVEVDDPVLAEAEEPDHALVLADLLAIGAEPVVRRAQNGRSEEHTSELQSPCNLVCRLLLEKKK